MVYMGSKAKYADKIVPILQKIINDNHLTTYIEPFVGGANIIDKILCENKFGFDKNATLIALHKKMLENPKEIPENGSSDWWYTAKEIYRNSCGDPNKMLDMELWKIGAIAFYASFSNGGFSRGYGKPTNSRNYYNEAYRNHMRQGEQPLYKDINFQWINDYSLINCGENSLIYCDPPYEHTKPYGYKFEIGFNYSDYWNWIREQSKNNFVICSEQTFPEDFKIIWVKEDAKRTAGKDNNFKAIEKLGIYNEGKIAEYFKKLDF